MTARSTGRGDFWQALVTLTGATVLAAVVAALAPGLAQALRAWFAFELGARPGAAHEALAVWLTNLRVLAVLLLAAVAARAHGLVPWLDALVAVVVGGNVALVGLALGAYGPPLLAWLAHLPLEWAGLGVGLAAYLPARRATHCLPAVAWAAGSGAALLALAAVVEVWATPLRLP